MPELPEVTTTVAGINKVMRGLTIKNVWTDLGKKNVTLPHHKYSLKDAGFFKTFQKKVAGAKVLGAKRIGKNILINLSNGETILIHMKMTGHLLYGKYSYNKKSNSWTPDEKEKNKALRDPYNRFIHAVFALSNGKHLAFSDTRKFGKIIIVPSKEILDEKYLGKIGPEPLEKTFTFNKFRDQLNKKPSWKIKQALMDQSVIAGIGNIYSDEMLWLSDIHPESRVNKIPLPYFKKLYSAMKKVLLKGIDFGGDSMSDYRNIHGEPGRFQLHHNVYRKTKSACGKKNCTGVIIRKVVAGRSAHFCPKHQILFK